MCAIPPFFLCAFFYVSFSFFYVLLLTKHDAFRGRSMEFRIKGKGREVSFATLCISRRFADTALQLIVRIKLRNVFSTLCFKLWEWPNCRIGPRFIASGQARARDEDERECKRKGRGGKGRGIVCLSRYGRVLRCTYYICFNLV